MKRTLLSMLAALAILSAPAAAAPITFVASLSGAAEEPPNASPGTGTAFVTIDDVAHTMQVSAEFSGLLGTSTVAHIHVIDGPGDPITGDTLGPVATTTPTFPGFPAGVTAGVYFPTTFDMTLATSYRAGFVTDSGGVPDANAALFAAILEGRAYFNIHSSTFSGGEIRGFLRPARTSVPEPGMVSLLVIGAAALVGRRRRTS